MKLAPLQKLPGCGVTFSFSFWDREFDLASVDQILFSRCISSGQKTGRLIVLEKCLPSHSPPLDLVGLVPLLGVFLETHPH